MFLLIEIQMMESRKFSFILRFIFYSLTLGIIFTQLFFYGTLCLIPFDLMIFGEENQNMWGFLCIILFGSFAILYIDKLNSKTTNHTYWKRSRELAMIISQLLSIFLIGLSLWSFLRFSGSDHSPWLIQAGLYIREHGSLWGISLGTSVFTGFLIIDELKKYELCFASTIWNSKTSFFFKSLTLSLSFLFTGITFLLYRYHTLFGVFTLFLLLSSSSFVFLWSIYFINRTYTPQNEKKPKLDSKKRISNGIIILLLVISTITVLTMLLYPFNLNLHFRLTRLPIHQVLGVLVGLIIGIAVIYHFSEYLKENFFFSQMNPQNRLKKSLKIILQIVIVITVVINFFVLGFGFYIYEFVLFLPQVIAKTVFWAILGVIVYLCIENFVKKSGIRRLILVVVGCLAISSQIFNFIFMLSDLQINALEGIFLRNTEIDMIFPFPFLFSITNILITGINTGFLLGSFIGKSNQVSQDSTASKDLICFLVFLAPATVGLLIGVSSILVNIPGGEPSIAYIPLDVIIPILISGMILVAILIISSFLLRRDQKLKKNISSKFKDAFTRISHTKETDGDLKNKIRASILISGIVFVGFIGGLAAILAIESINARSFPILSYTQHYSVWMANSSERFNKDISINPVKSPQIDAIEFSVAKNEYHAFQLGWTLDGNPLTDFKCTISNFTLNSNSSVLIPQNTSQIRYEEFIFEDEFPDKLVPFEKINLESKRTHFLWFDIRTPYNATSGQYTGNIRCDFILNGELEESIIPIRFFVWDFAIPIQRHLRTVMGESEFISGMIDVAIDNWVQHRFNMFGNLDLISGTVDYTEFQVDKYKVYYLNTSRTEDEWTFNWTWWDNHLESLINSGMNAIELSYMVNGSLNLGRTLLLDYPIENQWFLDWLTQVEAHFDAKGWLNICYYYFVDEFTIFIPDGFSRVEYYDACELQLQQMKIAAPKLRILAVAPPTPELENLKPYFDIYCPVSYDYDVEEWNKAKDDGKEMWFYTCIYPLVPYPNVHLYNRLYESRLLMWNAWYIKADGYLFWRANSGFHGQYGLGFNGYGDGFFIFENRTSYEIYDSTRWENLADGQEDYEILWLLNATLDQIEKQVLLDSNSIEEIRDKMEDIVDLIADSRLDYTRNPDDIYNGRHEIGEMLHELSSIIDVQSIGEAPWFPVSGIPH